MAIDTTVSSSDMATTPEISFESSEKEEFPNNQQGYDAYRLKVEKNYSILPSCHAEIQP